jgi:hypothetical protein
VIIKLLYLALVVCVVALLVVAAAGYMRVRKHLHKPHPPEAAPGESLEQK